MTIDLTAPGSVEALKSKPFTIKEGAKFRMKANFVVQHDVLSGLKYLQITKRKGIRVAKNEEMIVNFTNPIPKRKEKKEMAANQFEPIRAHSHPTRRRSPCMRRNVSPFFLLPKTSHQGNPSSNKYSISVEPDEAPTGMLARGHYEAMSKFTDDDNHDYLKFEWSFDITKDWK